MKVVKALKRNDDGVTHAAIDMLCALMQVRARNLTQCCPQSPLVFSQQWPDALRSGQNKQLEPESLGSGLIVHVSKFDHGLRSCVEGTTAVITAGSPSDLSQRSVLPRQP